MACKLIVGLGNPGPEYARTRHNAGFWFVEALGREQAAVWRMDTRTQAEVARLRVAGQELWLLKPMAFMNRSGPPVATLANFYKIAPDEILVAHDDLDLPVGAARLKAGGGHGGHNGLRDLIAHLGADFWRLRFGIGHPGHRDEVTDYVLQRPRVEELEQIEQAVQRALVLIPELITGGAQRMMNRLHERAAPEAPRPEGKK